MPPTTKLRQKCEAQFGSAKMMLVRVTPEIDQNKKYLGICHFSTATNFAIRIVHKAISHKYGFKACSFTNLPSVFTRPLLVVPGLQGISHGCSVLQWMGSPPMNHQQINQGILTKGENTVSQELRGDTYNVGSIKWVHIYSHSHTSISRDKSDWGVALTWLD